MKNGENRMENPAHILRGWGKHDMMPHRRLFLSCHESCAIVPVSWTAEYRACRKNQFMASEIPDKKLMHFFLRNGGARRIWKRISVSTINTIYEGEQP